MITRNTFRNFGLSLSTVLLASQIAFGQAQQMQVHHPDPAETGALPMGAEPADAPAADDAAANKAEATTTAAPFRVLTHTVSASNTYGYITTIDDPMANGNPDLILIATPKWDAIYNDHNIGVWYDGQHWTIFNEDFAGLPMGAEFNVRIGTGFLHEANYSNIAGNWTEIDNPLTNNNPGAKIQVTPNWGPNGASGIYVNHPLGVWYTGSKWAVFYQDYAQMDLNATFNVVIDNTFVHEATGSNSTFDYTIIDNPLTNGKPNAKLVVTSNWNPGGSDNGIYNNHAIGVFYTSGKWAIFNQDIAAVPNGACFNVTVYNPPTIASASVVRRKLVVNGAAFTNGAVVTINGVDFTTINKITAPTTQLIARRAANSIPVGVPVTIQVRNVDGLLSDPMTYTR